MEAHTANGEKTHLVIDVPRGTGRVLTWRTGPAALALEPEEVSRLREILADAQAVALQDRGHW